MFDLIKLFFRVLFELIMNILTLGGYGRMEGAKDANGTYDFDTLVKHNVTFRRKQ